MQEELRFARQGGGLVEHAHDEVLLHRLRVVEGQQICRHAAADALDPRVVHGGKTRMKAGGFQVAEGTQENLGRPPPKQRAAPPQDLAFQEAEIGAAQDEHAFSSKHTLSKYVWMKHDRAYPCQPARRSPRQMSATGWRSRTSAACRPRTNTSAASGRLL